jgi:1-acyl-sn-glycerol-3-phosphate acyltransferase
LILSIFGHIEIRGTEKLAGLRTNVIFAANHSSEFDVFLIPGSLPFFSRFSPIFYTSRERSFYKNAGWRQHFYGGTFFEAWGAYAVQVGLNDYEKSLSVHIGIVNDGGNLLVFPEGGTTKDGNLRPAKGGISYLAHATGRPIIPVRLDGTYHLSPSEFFLGKRRLSITFGDPIYVTSTSGPSLTPDECKVYANTVMEKIRSMENLRLIFKPVAVVVPTKE